MQELVLRNRSCRRFNQEAPVALAILRGLVDLARQTASASNSQPLKYVLSSDARKNADIFPHLAWAAYLKDWSGPEEGERPAGYIVILGDRRIRESFGCDHGIAAQTILLGAVEKGLAGCMIASVRKAELAAALALPGHFEVLLVIALGMAREEAVLDPVGPDGDIRYWRDSGGVHHVPKRGLDEVIIAAHGC